MLRSYADEEKEVDVYEDPMEVDEDELDELEDLWVKARADGTFPTFIDGLKVFIQAEEDVSERQKSEEQRSQLARAPSTKEPGSLTRPTVADKHRAATIELEGTDDTLLRADDSPSKRKGKDKDKDKEFGLKLRKSYIEVQKDMRRQNLVD
ncbi:MAG: hypothetical protein Q9218_003213 [Villophora microphyllina]